jgi:hypothetical protein
MNDGDEERDVHLTPAAFSIVSRRPVGCMIAIS